MLSHDVGGQLTAASSSLALLSAANANNLGIRKDNPVPFVC